MKKSEAILAAICGFLLGVIVGFILSPAKKGFELGNNCGNTTNNHFGKDEDDYEYDFDMEEEDGDEA